ncbi:unnamed protein product, partial [Meganyctiphanes norvegica]
MSLKIFKNKNNYINNLYYYLNISFNYLKISLLDGEVQGYVLQFMLLPKPSLMSNFIFIFFFALFFCRSTVHEIEFLMIIHFEWDFVCVLWVNWCVGVWFLYMSMLMDEIQAPQTYFLWHVGIKMLFVILFQVILGSRILLCFSQWFKARLRRLEIVWILKIVYFMIMYSGIINQMYTNDPLKWEKVPLNIHFESQCIPTPLAWYFHQLPSWWNQLSVVATFVIEIPVPFLFFSPVRNHRLFACYMQIMLQILIISTGNYNFFNLLTLTLCISLFDDVHLGYQYVRYLLEGHFYHQYVCYWWLGVKNYLYYTRTDTNLKIHGKSSCDGSGAFSRHEFDAWISKAVPLSIAIGAFSLLITVAEALTSTLFEVRGFFTKCGVFSATLLYSMLAIVMFGISLVPYSVLDRPTSQRVWPVFKSMYSQTDDFHLTSSYGLFRRMTGVDGRPEVILEGANDLNESWVEYEFSYKPGNVDEPLSFVAPHQPRLDWQMWFAALGSYSHNPWLISLAHRLLSGQPEVLKLLRPDSPWIQNPPKYIKAAKYLYHFTDIKEGETGLWWKREQDEDYLPIFTVDHPPLVEYLRKIGTIGTMDIPVTNQPLVNLLDTIRSSAEIITPEQMLWSLFITGILIIWTKRAI